MASVVFLRGVNVGGHKTFRPSAVVRELAELDVVNVGAAGTFVVRSHASVAEVRMRFLKCLPFATCVMVCGAQELKALVKTDPFSAPALHAADGQYISVLETRPRRIPPLPLRAPAGPDWQVGVVAVHGRYAVSVLRRVGQRLVYPNEVVERHFGVPATTRGWQTLLKVCQALEAEAAPVARRKKSRPPRSRFRK